MKKNVPSRLLPSGLKPLILGTSVALAVALLATTAQAQTLVTTPVWQRTDLGSTLNRELAYNPATGNLLLVNRSPAQIVRLQSSDGVSAGVDMDLTGVTGASFAGYEVSGIAVQDDGTIFVCNYVAGSQSTSPLKIYKWESETGVSTLVASLGTLAGATTDRFGAALDVFVRPGVSTNLLISGNQTTAYIAIFDSAGWTFKRLTYASYTQTLVPCGSFVDYNASGYANQFRVVGKSRGSNGRLYYFNPASASPIAISSVAMGAPYIFYANGISSHDYDPRTKLLAGTTSTIQASPYSFTNVLCSTVNGPEAPIQLSAVTLFATGADGGQVASTVLGQDGRFYSAVAAAGGGVTAFDITAFLVSGPGNVYGVVGDASATLNTVFGGSGLSYQWAKGATPLSDGTKYSGATTASLTVSNLVLGDQDEYTVTVSGAGASSASVSSILYVNNSGAVPGDRIWNGGDADDNLWSSADNWSGTALNNAGDKVFFDGTTRLTPVMNGFYSVNGITFNSGAGAFNISASSGSLALGGGVTNNSSTSEEVLNVPMTLALGQVFNSDSNNIVVSNSISGAGSITKLGAQTLKLRGSSANSFNGLTVSAGNVVLGKTGGNAVAGNITLASGTSLSLEGSNQISDTSVIDLQTGNATMTLPSGVTDTIRGFSVGPLNTDTNSGSVQLGANAELTIKPLVAVGYSAVPITGAAGTKFIVDSAGGELRWTPTNMVNTFEKLVIQNGGRLRCGHGGNLWMPQDTMLGTVPSTFTQDQITINTGTLGLNGGVVFNPPSAANTLVVNGNRGLTISGTATLETFENVVWPGKITGTGKLVHSGGADLALLGANDYSGGTDVAAGSITINGANTLGSGPIRWTSSAGILAVSTEGLTIPNRLDFSQVLNFTFGTPYNATNFICSGDIDMGNAGNRPQINVTNATTTITFTGTMTNTLGLVKMGPGKLVLTGANTYGGGAVNPDTSVTNGTLIVNNTTGSATSAGTVNVYPNGTLGGNGIIDGSVVVDGTISPGTSVGTLTTGAQTWNAGGSYVFEMNDATGTAGSSPGWDKLAVQNLTITADAGNKFNIKVKSLAGAVPGNAANFNNTVPQTWTILSTAGGMGAFDPAAFNIDTTGFSNSLGWGYFTTAATVYDLELKFVVRAEPTNLVAAVSGGVFTGGTFTGTPDSFYTVRYTDSLNPVNWQLLTVATTDGAGVGSFADPGPLPTQRFYRIFSQ